MLFENHCWARQTTMDAIAYRSGLGFGLRHRGECFQIEQADCGQGTGLRLACVMLAVALLLMTNEDARVSDKQMHN
jgi:hypothetical protein